MNGTYQRLSGFSPRNRVYSRYPVTCRLISRYPLSTTTSQVSMLTGQLKRPMPGMRCHARSMRPRSTFTNARAMTMAAMARISPTMTTSCMALSSYRYAGMTIITAPAARPTAKAKLAM